jgi:hypothetical protein
MADSDADLTSLVRTRVILAGPSSAWKSYPHFGGRNALCIFRLADRGGSLSLHSPGIFIVACGNGRRRCVLFQKSKEIKVPKPSTGRGKAKVRADFAREVRMGRLLTTHQENGWNKGKVGVEISR